MKRAHIVHAHPEPQSFVAAMRDTAIAALNENGWQVSLSDLYAPPFNAMASGDDFADRHDPEYLVYSLEQRHAVAHGSIAADIAREIERVKAADLLILVFPIFWYSVPAVMKGWIDRVFVSGEFYGGKRIYDRGGMRGKKALVVAALGGREGMFGPQAIHGELTGMLRHLLQGTLGYVGFDVATPFFAHHVPYISNEERTAMLSQLKAEIANLDQRELLPMPSLNDFDEQLLPLRAHPL